MSVFFLIIFGLPILGLIWWRWADGRLRGLPRARLWRGFLAVFSGGNLALYVWIILTRRLRWADDIPAAILGLTYLWHLLILPAALLLVASGSTLWGLGRGVRFLLRRPHPQAESDADCPAADAPDDPPAPATQPAPVVLTRRQALAAACVALPPVLAVGAQAYAQQQLRTFRIRPLEVWLPTLPPALDGLTIAHVSDTHVGRFTGAPLLAELVTRTRALQPALGLFTGDLLDHALDDLPAGITMLQQIAPRERLFVVEGNHDLFEGREAFENGVRAAGLNLLLNESAVVTLRGQRVQLLGIRWGSPGSPRGALYNEHLADVLPLRDPTAFPILLAHHPHVFDAARDAGLPLTLAGHTHGGQLMLTEHLGAGSVLFKYWSGLYCCGNAALVVSNGAGNWFPLRINAPAEVVHLTLRAGAATSRRSSAGARRESAAQNTRAARGPWPIG